MTTQLAAPPNSRQRAKTARMSAYKTPHNRKDLLTALVFIAPAALGFIVFFLIPTLRGFYFSLTS